MKKKKVHCKQEEARRLSAAEVVTQGGDKKPSSALVCTMSVASCWLYSMSPAAMLRSTLARWPLMREDVMSASSRDYTDSASYGM